MSIKCDRLRHRFVRIASVVCMKASAENTLSHMRRWNDEKCRENNVKLSSNRSLLRRTSNCFFNRAIVMDYMWSIYSHHRSISDRICFRLPMESESNKRHCRSLISVVIDSLSAGCFCCFLFALLENSSFKISNVIISKSKRKKVGRNQNYFVDC